jgi:hypothetical protein
MRSQQNWNPEADNVVARIDNAARYHQPINSTSVGLPRVVDIEFSCLRHGSCELQLKIRGGRRRPPPR